MSSLCLPRQLDLRQMAGLDEKECKQSARRSRGGQGDYQRNRQESDDLNTKGSMPTSAAYHIDVLDCLKDLELDETLLNGCITEVAC